MKRAAEYSQAKVLQGQPGYGYSLGLGSPLAAELLAGCDIDWLMLETQDGSWGHDEVMPRS